MFIGCNSHLILFQTISTSALALTTLTGQEYRDEFCRELVNTIPEWVYSQSKAAAVLNSLIAEGKKSAKRTDSIDHHDL